MNVKVEALDKHRVTLTIDVTAEEVQKGFKEAVTRIAGQINLKGFRKGKAPRKVLEMYIGKEGVASEAEDVVMHKVLNDALRENKLVPVTTPDVKTVSFSEKDGASFTATFVKQPEVKLGDYKGLSADHKHPTVSDDAVTAQLQQAAAQSARLEVKDGAALEKGDYAVIDFQGKVDGKPFQGGEGKTYPLEIGSGSFIPGFEDQLVGHKAGDDVVVKVTFPKEYFVEALAGKEAEFSVHVNDVKRKVLPELNDDFAKSVSKFDTLDELKASLKQQMQLRALQDAEEEYHNALVEKAVANAEVDIPDEMVEQRIDEMIQEMKLNIEANHSNFEEYLKSINKTEADLRKDYKETAKENVRQSLVLSAIAEAEDLKVTDQDLSMEVYSMAQQFGADPKDVVKIIKEENRVGMLIASVTRKKAAAFIYGAAKAEEKAAEEKAAKEEAPKAEEKAEEAPAEEKPVKKARKPRAKKAKAPAAEEKSEEKAEAKTEE